ncbi:MAG: DNA polymerase IV, partial [Clostridiales bacterium]|nr:DNA polymerase IV [Clostridiales bacterium]
MVKTVMDKTSSIDKTIIHVDMDAFYAAVEARDNPELRGKPLIIGALPGERGVVSTCSYEARKYGVRSAMPISEAHRLCPDGIYLRPNFHKYEAASAQIHEIWGGYTDIVEYISLDEGFLDVSRSMKIFGSAPNIAHAIKEQVKLRTGLTCSVGIGYSMMSAKLASEEKKPDGYFEIRTPEALRNLIIDRSVRVVYGVGPQTEAELQRIGVYTVRDVYANRQTVVNALGSLGKLIVDLADGVDEREVAARTKSLSLGKEHTFQQDVMDFEYLKDVLRLIARELSYQIRLKGIYCRTVTLKLTYKGMKRITRSQSGDGTNRAADIYGAAASLLEKVEKRPVRLIGITLSGFTEATIQQASLFDADAGKQAEKRDSVILALQRRYGLDAIKTGSELHAEKRL